MYQNIQVIKQTIIDLSSLRCVYVNSYNEGVINHAHLKKKKV